MKSHCPVGVCFPRSCRGVTLWGNKLYSICHSLQPTKSSSRGGGGSQLTLLLCWPPLVGGVKGSFWCAVTQDRSEHFVIRTFLVLICRLQFFQTWFFQTANEVLRFSKNDFCEQQTEVVKGRCNKSRTWIRKACSFPIDYNI